MKWNEIIFNLFWVYIVMYCENCGVFFEQVANFCRVCGKNVKIHVYTCKNVFLFQQMLKSFHWRLTKVLNQLIQVTFRNFTKSFLLFFTFNNLKGNKNFWLIHILTKEANVVLEVVVQRCSVKKVFLEIFQNSQESTCGRVSFLIKLQGWGLQLY